MSKELASSLLILVLLLTSVCTVNARWVEKWNFQHNQNLGPAMFTNSYLEVSRMEGDLDGDGVFSVIFYSVGEAKNEVVVYNSISGEKEFEKDLMSEFGPSGGTPFIADIDKDGRDEIVFGFEGRAVAYEQADYPNANRSASQNTAGKRAEMIEKWNVRHNLNLGPGTVETSEVRVSGMTEGDFDGDGVYSVVVYSVSPVQSGVVILNGVSGEMEFTKDLKTEFGPAVGAPFVADLDKDGRDEIVFHYKMNSLVYGFSSSASGIQPPESNIPKKTELAQIYPSPFNAMTTISYQIETARESPVHVDLSIYNVLGQRVVTLVSEEQSVGTYTVNWDAADYPLGIYFCRLETSTGFVQSRKLIVVR